MNQLSNCCDAPPLSEIYGVVGRCSECGEPTLFHNDEKPDPTMRQVDCVYCDGTGIGYCEDCEIAIECSYCNGRGWNEYDKPIDDHMDNPQKL